MSYDSESCDMISYKLGAKMFRYVFLSALFILSVAGEGEIRLLATPDSLQLIGHDPIDNNALKELFPALLGLTIEKPSNWSGLEVSSPFHYSKAAVILVADGVTSLETSLDPLDTSNVHVFALTSTENERVLFDDLKRRIEERYPPASPNVAIAPLEATVKRINLDDRVAAGEGTEPLRPENLKFLDAALDGDQRFLQELVALKEFVSEVRSGTYVREGIPNVYWVVLKSLKSVAEFHGQDSDATQEAKRLVKSMAQQLSSASATAYGKKVVVATVALPDVPDTRSHARYPRAVTDAPSTTTPKGLSDQYAEDYPVIFNIILWFGVVFAFSLLAVSLSIAYMDPGRDSIIYRMTSTRMKKDN